MAEPDDETQKRSSALRPRTPESSGERSRGDEPVEDDHAIPIASGGGYQNYVVKGEQGRGGLGRVLRAHDRRLDRPVAIKEILAAGPDAADAASRFLREARLTAQLQHPSIVPVYEIGFRDDGAPFYAMKLIAGESFDAAIARTRSLDERLALLPNVLAVAEAIAYAHDRHIIHRDLKPSNVILGAFGETVVIDWGVAKDLGAAGSAAGASIRPREATAAPQGATAEVAATAALGDTILALGDTSDAQTRAGRTLGTLGYMPPEQFRGEEVDERADVFALGAFLYQTITGVGPYDAQAKGLVLDRIARGATTPIESREPAVPPDLAAIARKAMSPAREDRYASAKELAADVKRFLTGQLVSAHAYSRRVLVARWVARNRRLVILAMAFAIALAAIGVVSVRGVLRERDRAEAERGRAQARAQELTLVQARSSLDRDPTASLAWLKTATFDDASRDEILSIAADAQARGVARVVLRAKGLGELTGAVMSLDGARVYAGPEQPGLVEWDLTQGNRMRLIPTSMTLLDPLPTADESHAIAGSFEGDLLDIDLATGALRVLTGHKGRSFVAPSPAGHRLASCAVDGSVRTWDLDTGQGRIVGAHADACLAVDFAPDAQSIASEGSDQTLHIWDLRAGTSRSFPVVIDEFRGLGWSAGGATIAIVGKEESRALDVASGLWRRIPGKAALNAATFLPGTEMWVGGDVDGVIRITDLAGGSERTLRGHTTAVHTLEAPDAQTLLSCADEESARVWDLPSGTSRLLRGHPGLKDCRFSRKGRVVLTSGNDGMVRVWDLPDRGLESTLAGHTGEVFAAAFSPDGSRLATGSDDHVVRVWDVATHAGFALEGHTDVVEAVAFLDASHIASSSDDRTLRIWDLSDRSSVVLPHTMRVLRVAPTRDGRAVLTSCTDGLVRVWDVARREAVVLRGHTGAADYAELSPDEERVVSGSDDGTVRVWDRRTGKQLLVIDARDTRITGVQFAAGGALLASSGGDGLVHLWDARTGAPVRTLSGHTDRIRFLGVSSDGRRLVTSSNDHTVRIWDVASGASLVLRGHASEVRRAEFSPDGRWVVSSSYDQTTRVWDARTGRLLALARSDGAVMRSIFSPDGSLVAAVGFDRMVHIDRVDPARFLPGEAGPFRAWLDSTTSAVVEGGAIVSPVAAP